MITAYNKNGGVGFTEDVQRILSIVAAQSAQVVENARLNERERQVHKIQAVGRDYFDFIPVNGPRLAVSVGDVTCKVFPASLLMANAQATVRGQTLMNSSACEGMIRSKKFLFDTTGPENLMTMFHSLPDTSSNQLSDSHAGHANPYLVSATVLPKR